jgi:hypothetical protein
VKNKIHLFFFLFFSFIISCSTTKNKEIELLGGDRDSNSCIPSAGFTWSSIKKECIRVFELELQLKTIDESSIIGLIFANDKKMAEVFTKEGTFLLEMINENYYITKQLSRDYFLKNQNGNWVFGTLSDKKISHKQFVTH